MKVGDVLGNILTGKKMKKAGKLLQLLVLVTLLLLQISLLLLPLNLLLVAPPLI